MPSRPTPFVNQQMYHVFNRGIDGRTTFLIKQEYERMVNLINYYRHINRTVSYSRFLELASDIENDLVEKFSNDLRTVDIFSFCLMPNHFHFLLKQIIEGGIQKYLGDLQNSYTRYFNIKNKRKGQLFLGQFKAVLVESEAQFLHVSRYIHLNPYSAKVVKDFDELTAYPWSSLPEYLSNNKRGFCRKDEVLGSFQNDIEKYRQFLFDQKDYQRKLKSLDYLMLD